jgi:hypothetical protein
MEPVMPPGTDRGGRGASLLNMSKRLSVACRSSAKAAAGTTENSVTHATARVIDTTGLHVLETLTPPNSPAAQEPANRGGVGASRAQINCASAMSSGVPADARVLHPGYEDLLFRPARPT